MKKVNHNGTMKLANKPTEKRESANALEARPGYQKLLNKVLYKKGELKPIPRPSTQRSNTIELSDTGKLPEGAVANYLKKRELNQIGIEDFDIQKNKRDPFDIKRAKQPDSQFPNPGPTTPYRPAVTVVNGVDQKETQVQAQIRVLPMFYALWKEWLSADDILTNDYATVIDSLRESGLPTHIKDISENKLREFLETVRDIYDETAKESQKNTSILTESLFHTTETKLQEVLSRLEYAGPQNIEQYIVDTFERTVDGSYLPVRKIAVGGAVAISRYIGFLISGIDYIRIMYEHDSQRCLIPIGRPGKNRRSSDIYEPLVTLKSNQCVKILNGLDTFLQMKSLVDTSEFFYGNWIVLDKKYFPLLGETTEQIVAKAIPYASYIQNAFNNWAIDAMDRYLFQLFEIKYPQYSMKLSTYISTPQRFLRLKSTVERERGDYPIGKGNFDFVNFMLIDDEILKENTTFLSHVNPFEGKTAIQDITKEAINSQTLYGISPYIAYFMKRKYMDLYYNAFKTPGVEKFEDDLVKILRTYNSLSEQEKITFDYLQYLYFLDTFQGIVLQPLNENRQGTNVFRERFKQVSGVYKEKITPQVYERIRSLYQKEKAEILSTLQRMVGVAEPDTTPAFIRGVLQKFTKPSDRFANIQEEHLQTTVLSALRPQMQTRKQQRNVLLQEIKALEKEKQNLSKKMWNPFKTKTRKQRAQEINQTLVSLQRNLEEKQSAYNRIANTVTRAEEQMIQVPVTRQMPASVYSNALEMPRINRITGLGSRANPFN